MTEPQIKLLLHPYYTGATIVSLEDFLAENRLTKIDFLKCDIEGSEFELFEPSRPLLAMTEQIAIEIHDHAGNRKELLQLIRDSGFEIGMIKNDSSSCVALAKRPNKI